MLRLILLMLAAAITILTVLCYLALRYLPTWGVLLGIPGLVLAIWVFSKFFWNRFVTSLLLIPFKAKGACLRNADVEVHSIEPVAPPAVESHGEGEGSASKGAHGDSAEHYRLEVTITPKQVATPFQFWEPDELLMMPYAQRIRLDGKEEDGDSVTILDCELVRHGAFPPDDSGKYHGPLRLRLHIAVPRGMSRRLKFRYYVEGFGDITLPSASTSRQDPSASPSVSQNH